MVPIDLFNNLESIQPYSSHDPSDGVNINERQKERIPLVHLKHTTHKVVIQKRFLMRWVFLGGQVVD